MSYYRQSLDSQASDSPHLNQRISQTNYNYTNRQSKFSKGTMKSRPENAYRNYQQQMKSLAQVDYLNPIARLQYEQKLIQMHTKKTAKSQQTVNMKLRSKNQVAEFIDQQEEYDQIFDQMMQYKYGNQGNSKQFYYNRESIKKQFIFCPMCDKIHSDTPTRHTLQCDYKQLSKSPLYYFQSLDRIKQSLTRLMSQQAKQLAQIANRIRRAQNVSKQLSEINQITIDDPVLNKICEKLTQIVIQTQS